MENRRVVRCALSAALLFATAVPSEAQGDKPPQTRTAEQRRAAAEARKLDKISAVVRGKCIDAQTGETSS